MLRYRNSQIRRRRQDEPDRPIRNASRRREPHIIRGAIVACGRARSDSCAHGHVSPLSRSRVPGAACGIGASEDQSAAVTSSAPAKQRASWSSGWKWMWIPATAFAGLIGVAVVQHFRHAAPGTQMTAKLSQTDSPSSPEPANAPATSPKLATHPT